MKLQLAEKRLSLVKIKSAAFMDYKDFTSIRYFSDVSPDEIIASGASDFFGASIAVDKNGKLHVTFPAGPGNIMYMLNE